jgi:hypothetical protein
MKKTTTEIVRPTPDDTNFIGAIIRAATALGLAIPGIPDVSVSVVDAYKLSHTELRITVVSEEPEL